MSDREYFEGVLYQYELLRTRLGIREYYLTTAVKEVYENIGQVLSLIRLQLAMVQADMKNEQAEKLEPLRQMTGEVIRDLRKMCRIFYPEEDIIYVEGFSRILKNEIKTHWPRAEFISDTNFSDTRVLSKEKMLLLFGMLLQLITLLKEDDRGLLHQFAIISTRQQINFIIDYTGAAIPLGKDKRQPANLNLALFERVKLIGGYLELNNKKDDLKRITLIIPLTQNL